MPETRTGFSWSKAGTAASSRRPTSPGGNKTGDLDALVATLGEQPVTQYWALDAA